MIALLVYKRVHHKNQCFNNYVGNPVKSMAIETRVFINKFKRDHRRNFKLNCTVGNQRNDVIVSMFTNIETIKSVTVVFIYVFKSPHKVRVMKLCLCLLTYKQLSQ